MWLIVIFVLAIVLLIFFERERYARHEEFVKQHKKVLDEYKKDEYKPPEQ